MKKVLFVITKSVWGGAQKYVHDISVNLPQNDFQAIVAGGGNGPMAEKIRSAGLPYIEIKNFQRDVNFLKEFFSFFEILKILFKTNPNIVHVSSSKAGGVAGVATLVYLTIKKITKPFRMAFPYNNKEERALLFSGSPIKIFTVHGWAFLEIRPKWQIWLIKLASKLTCIFYDKIICVSRNDYNEALKNKIAPARKLIMIHNGVKPEDYSFLERTEKEFIIGAIGESVKNKGHKYLEEATKKLSGIKLNILSGVSDASRYLKSFDIFVLPSIKEGLPYVVLEAGLAGLPVIATNVGGIPEIIEDGKNGLLIQPTNAQEIVNAVKKLIADKTLRETLAKNLNEKIKKEFSLEKMMGKTMEAYK